MGPIGVFDSGVGGLSVLRALLLELPHEQFVYVADSGMPRMANAMTTSCCSAPMPLLTG